MQIIMGKRLLNELLVLVSWFKTFLPILVCSINLILSGIFIGPAAFRPRAHAAATYTPSIEKGRPVLQGLLAIDFLAKEACLTSCFFISFYFRSIGFGN